MLTRKYPTHERWILVKKVDKCTRQNHRPLFNHADNQVVHVLIVYSPVFTHFFHLSIRYKMLDSILFHGRVYW